MRGTVATARVAGVLAALALGAAAPVEAETYRFMTGPQGGSWYPLGGAISNYVQRSLDDVRVRVMPGGGITNVMAVQAGKAQLGLGNVTTTVDAIAGNPPFREPATEVRHLATLYPQYFQFVVAADGGIETVADMAGRAIAVGPRGHSGEQASLQVLDVYGLTYDDLSNVNHVGYTDAVSLFKDGHVDAYTVFTTIPAGAVMDTASARSVRVLSLADDKLEALKAHNPQYVRSVIPQGTYPDMAGEVRTFGTWTHVIARADLPDDAAYGIVEALSEHLGDLAAVVKAMDGMTLESLATPVGVPFHPSAERFYRDRGVLD
jgi:TRAP transporter TAXI family solute receptor